MKLLRPLRSAPLVALFGALLVSMFSAWQIFPISFPKQTFSACHVLSAYLIISLASNDTVNSGARIPS